MVDFLLKVSFVKDGELVDGIAVEMFSPFSFKVFRDGNTTVGRYPAHHIVNWDFISKQWVAI